MKVLPSPIPPSPDGDLEYEEAIPAHLSPDSRRIVDAFLKSIAAATAYALLSIAAKTREELNGGKVSIPKLIEEDFGDAGWDRTHAAKMFVLRCCETIRMMCGVSHINRAELSDADFIGLVSIEVYQSLRSQVINAG